MTQVKIEMISSELKGFAFCSRQCRVLCIGAFVAIIMMMNTIVDASTKNLIPLEKNPSRKSMMASSLLPETRRHHGHMFTNHQAFHNFGNRLIGSSLANFILFWASSEASSKLERGVTIGTARG